MYAHGHMCLSRERRDREDISERKSIYFMLSTMMIAVGYTIRIKNNLYFESESTLKVEFSVCGGRYVHRH